MRMRVKNFWIVPLLLLGAAPALAGPPAKPPPKTGAPAATASASAEPAAPPASATPSPAVLQAANDVDGSVRQSYLDAAAAFEKGDKAKAEELLRAAWKSKPHWQIAAILGAVEMALDKPTEAATFFAYYQRNARADEQAKAAKLLAEAAAKCGTIVVSADPSDVEISLDGARLDVKSGEPFYVTADEHHKVTVRRGERSEEIDLVVQAGKRHEEKVVMLPTTTWRKEIVIPGAVVAGAGVIAGAVMVGVGFSLKADGAKLRDDTVAAHGGTPCVNNGLPECKKQSDLLVQGNLLANAGMWTLIGGGIVGLGTAAYMLVARPAAPPPVQAGVVVGPNGGGAVVRWRF